MDTQNPRHPHKPAETKPPKGERELIRRLADQFPSNALPVGFGNDMAVLEPRAGGLLWTVDMLMDGVDFESSKHRWLDIGHKAMAVNLSDCAAAAAVPIAAICAVALHERLSMEDALELLRGAQECGAEFDCPIVGGDTNSWSHPTVISISVAARPDGEHPPTTRGGAQPGDLICLTGPVGGSRLARHLRPVPRIHTAIRINRKLKPHAMIDISDGLAIDLWHICEASNCGATVGGAALDAVIHADAFHIAQKTGKPPRHHALYDGEDFELIVALPPTTSVQACEKHGLLPLGEITAERELILCHENGRREPLAIDGWEHFRE